MNRFLIPRTEKWTNVSVAILMAVLLGGAHSAYAENKGAATAVKASVGLEDAGHAKTLRISEAKRRMETKLQDIMASLSEGLSQKRAPELQGFLQRIEKWNEHDSYVFFVERYLISSGYEKYKINAHPDPDAVGIFARKNVIAMNYIPKEDFFEEDCKQATSEGAWFGPYRNTKLMEPNGIYQISRKSMLYKKIPNTNHIIVGVVIQGHNKTNTVTERPNRFIANSSRSLQTERSGVERMARVRRNTWKRARMTFSD